VFELSVLTAQITPVLRLGSVTLLNNVLVDMYFTSVPTLIKAKGMRLLYALIVVFELAYVIKRVCHKYICCVFKCSLDNLP